MILLASIACLFLAGCSASQLRVLVKEKIFKESAVLYTGKHDIVKIILPLNHFNSEEIYIKLIKSSSISSSNEEIEIPNMLFFVEGDFKNEEVVNHGLYVFKDGKATKILDNGRDATATQTKTIYFGAKDGIYKYDNATNTATKHGNVTDSISQLAHNNKTNSIYYLTDDNEVYKLNEDLTASVKVPGLIDVQEMVFGFEGNLYYYNSDKEFYVVDIEAGGVPKKIQGLPANMNRMALISPLFDMELGAFLYVDKILYILKSNRASENLSSNPHISSQYSLSLRVDVPLTAQAPQFCITQFYAKDKKIYQLGFGYILRNLDFEVLEEDVISTVSPSVTII